MATGNKKHSRSAGAVPFLEACVFVAFAMLWVGVAPGRAQSAAATQAMAAQQRGDFAEAENDWRTAVTQNPQDAVAYANLGFVLAHQNKYTDAVPAYRKAAKLAPTMPGIQLNWGIAEFKLGHFEEAIDPLTAAVAADPGSGQARTLLGLSCYGAKRFADSIKYLEPVVQANPNSAELRKVLAQSCLLAKQFACAEREFRTIVEQNPNSAQVHILMGQALDGLGRTPEAITEFQEAVKENPKEPDANFGLGYLHWKSSHLDEAKASFEEELKVDPNHPQALAYLGDIALKNDKPEEAVKYFDRVVKQRKDIRIAYLDMGAALMELKRYSEAQTALQRAVELDPTQPDAHFRLGRLYQAMGENEKAKAEFAKVQQLHEKADDDVASKMPKVSTAPPE
jgi:tetratricopeptide (TPR) repeat protein